jgi:DUF4097 and DUF4098 domain-containing protein YvlB
MSLRSRFLPILALVLPLGLASSASAQSFDFTQTFPAGAVTTLDVTTTRGKIVILADATDGVLVKGTATVAVGWTVPADAEALAREVAAHPPIRQDGATLFLTPPKSGNVERSVTLAYEVHVPASTTVVATSQSGETRIERVAGAVTVRTQSSAILLVTLGGAATVNSGSGDVSVVGVGGDLSITTSSSAITASSLGGNLKVDTGSGRVEASFGGTGDADVHTASSSVTLRRLSGGVTVRTNSGQVTLEGTPARTWTVTTQSSAIEARMPSTAAATLDVSSRSGRVKVEGAEISGSVEKGGASGTVNGGGPTLAFSSRSGSIQITFGAAGGL